MSADLKWSLDTCCDVMDTSEYDDEEYIPEIQAENKRYVMRMHDVQQVVENAKLQKGNVSADELFNAFMYYFENDAFIDL